VLGHRKYCSKYRSKYRNIEKFADLKFHVRCQYNVMAPLKIFDGFNIAITFREYPYVCLNED